MDFKVAGTEKGITAFRMTSKIRGITPEVIREAFSQARVARHSRLREIAEISPKSETGRLEPSQSFKKSPLERRKSKD